MPNFLIIGAAKSGTTALYHYLKQHPQIYMSPNKEPKFFALEGQKLNLSGADAQDYKSAVVNINDYKKLFQGVTDELAIGEASTLYLYHPKAPERIHHYIPNTKLIAILRHPVERAYSGYIMHIGHGRETIYDFAQAIQEEKARISRNEIWGHYINAGFYYTQLSRYFDLFKREQIKIYLYENLKEKPNDLIRDIFQFLRVDHTFVPNVTLKYNVLGIPRNEFARFFSRKINEINPVVKQLFPDKIRHQVRSKIFKAPPPLLAEIRSDLIEVYRQDILQLQELINIDLSKWLE